MRQVTVREFPVAQCLFIRLSAIGAVLEETIEGGPSCTGAFGSSSLAPGGNAILIFSSPQWVNIHYPPTRLGVSFSFREAFQ